MATNATTQDFVPIKNIRDNVVIQTNGQMCMVVLASSINFALKSIDEQHAVLMQFQNFLNTLDFTLQIYVQSRKLNIEPYLALLGTLEDKQDNDLMRIQLREYIEFIATFTKDVDVMSKNFFVVVPYSPNKLNLTKNITNIFIPGSSEPKSGKTTDLEQNFEEHRTQLEQRVAMVSEGLARVGVKTIALGQDELVELFYHIYNPGDPTGTAPLVDNQT